MTRFLTGKAKAFRNALLFILILLAYTQAFAEKITDRDFHFSLDIPEGFEVADYTEDGMSYWAIKPQLNRLESTIYFMINLDACNACFDEAKDWMDSILDGCIFE